MPIPARPIPFSAALCLTAALFAAAAPPPTVPPAVPANPSAAPVAPASVPQAAAAAVPSAQASASSAAQADTIDRLKVHGEYSEGNFENVVRLLEDYRTGHESYRHVDSVFIAKYLGVIYSANPDSREKGKYWLYKMLQLQPNANLLDLYVGEAVEKVFERVRSEFIVRRNYRGINDIGLAKAVENGEPGRRAPAGGNSVAESAGGKRDTVVLKDTVVVKDNWIAPLTDGIKGGYDEVKGGIKAGIQGGYVPIEEKRAPDDSRWTGNINVGGGLKFLDKSQWEEVAGFSDETEVRVATDIRQRKWPINVALDFSYAFAPEVYQDRTNSGKGIQKQTVATYELNVGVRKIFDFRLYSVRPFFGGGFGRITTEWDLVSEQSDDPYRDGKLGIWLNGGCYWELDRHFNLGLEYLYSSATIEMYGKRNHGGHHVDMIVGFHF